LTPGFNCRYIPYTEELKELTEVGVPEELNISKEWANKKVALFAVPGMFVRWWKGQGENGVKGMG
jgi:hypothetical protein